MACTWWGRVWLQPALSERIPGGATEAASGGQPLGGVCSGSASPTPHLSLKSNLGHTCPRRNLPRGQQHLPPQFLQPHSASTPSTNLSTPQPSSRFRQTQWRNGHDLGLLLGRIMDAAQVAYGFCDHTRLTCFSDCLCSNRACIQWQQSLMASTPITWEQTPTHDRATITTRERGGPAQHPLQALVTTMPITPAAKGGDGQHTLRRDPAGIHTQSPCTKNTGLTIYTGMVPHENSFSRPQ